MKRRFFLFAAPAIVAAPSLMKVSALVLPPPDPPILSFHDLVTTTLRSRMPHMIAQIEQSNALLRQLREVSAITPEMLGVLSGKTPEIGSAPLSWWRNADTTNPLTS